MAATAPTRLGAAGVQAAATGPGCRVDVRDALQRINAARAAGRRCGSRAMPPAGPLHWDAELHSAASVHSGDMAGRNYFDHVTPEGRTLRQRLSAGPTRWRLLAENLAGNPGSDFSGALRDWMDSPAHCENLMDAQFTDVGVACAQQVRSDRGRYWTMLLGRR